MATPLFDAIDVEISRRIGDPVATASTAGKRFTAAERNAYTNKALLEYFNRKWEAYGGDAKRMLELLPELAISVPVTTDANGEYTLASPNLFLAKLVDGTLTSNSLYVKLMPQHLYNIVVSGDNSLYVPSATNLMVFEFATYLKFFPSATFNAVSVDIHFLRQPIQNSGVLIAQNGTQDSPFRWHHNSNIAAIGEELIRTDLQFAM